MKVCNICREEKDYTEFYANKGCSDGYQNRCKSCTKEKTREREELLKLSDPTWHDKNKQRHREKYHRLNYKEKHKPSSEKKKENISKYKQKYPEKYFAKNASSKLEKTIQSNELHHWSYSEPDWKDVIELSKEDHYLLHRYIKYDQSVMMYRTLDGKLLDSKESHVLLLAKIKEIEQN